MRKALFITVLFLISGAVIFAAADRVIETKRLIVNEASPGAEKLTIDPPSITSDRTLTWPDSNGNILSDLSTASMSNKNIDADLNTITNIEDADIKAGADIARSKIAGGTAEHVVINAVTTGDLSSEAQLSPLRGGTGQDTSGSTGIPEVNAGTWSVGASFGDLSDVSVSGAEDGQAMVYNGSTWEPGASGDSSFKPSFVDASDIQIKAGTRRFNGKLYCTHDGTGSFNEVNISSDLTYTPTLTAGVAKYYLYIDTDGLTNQVISDSGRDCWLVTDTDFHFSTSTPEEIADRYRYDPIGVFVANGSNQITAVYDERPEDSASWANIKLIEDKVRASYKHTTGQSIPSATVCPVDFNSKIYDETGTDNYTAGSGYTAATCAWSTQPVWTAPRAGTYHLDAQIAFGVSSNFDVDEVVAIYIYKNGSQEYQSQHYIESSDGTGTNNYYAAFSGDLELAEGDTLQIRAYQTASAAETLSTSPARTWFMVSEVTNAETNAVATPTNTFDSGEVTSDPGTTSCPTGFSDHTTGSVNPLNKAVSIDYWDNSYSSGKWFTGIQRDTIALSDRVCIKWLGTDWAASDKVRIKVGPGAQVTAIPDFIGNSDPRDTELGRKQYLEGTDWTLSGATLTTTNLGILIPYKLVDGTWRMKINLQTTMSSNTDHTLSISGIGNFSGTYALAVRAGGDFQTTARANNGSTTIITKSASPTTALVISGDIALSSKPTWAD